MEHYKAKIEEAYSAHDNYEAANLSFIELTEHPDVAFPEDDRTEAKRTIDNLLKP